MYDMTHHTGISVKIETYIIIRDAYIIREFVIVELEAKLYPGLYQREWAGILIKGVGRDFDKGGGPGF